VTCRTVAPDGRAEEHDDVDSVHANFDVPEEILGAAAAG
jgi:hypothetical protein